jgi:hypothetical protein
LESSHRGGVGEPAGAESDPTSGRDTVMDRPSSASPHQFVQTISPLARPAIGGSCRVGRPRPGRSSTRSPTPLGDGMPSIGRVWPAESSIRTSATVPIEQAALPVLNIVKPPCTMSVAPAHHTAPTSTLPGLQDGISPGTAVGVATAWNAESDGPAEGAATEQPAMASPMVNENQPTRWPKAFLDGPFNRTPSSLVTVHRIGG